MRIILTLSLISVLFSACDKDATTSEFSYYNPIEGQWDVFSDQGELLHTRVYTKQYYAYFSVIDGEKQNIIDSLHYNINGNKLIFDRYEQTFQINADTLWITNSKGDQRTKYIRKK